MKNMKKTGVLIILVALVALAGGGYFFLTKNGDNKDTPKQQENNENKEEEINSSEFKEKTIKEYSDYTNYDLAISSVASTGETTIEVNTNNHIDVKNNTIQTVTTLSNGTMSYYYYDIANKLEYYSSDNVKWEKNTNAEMTLPDFSKVIEYVKTLDNVAMIGGKTYQFTSNIVEGNTTLSNVLISVTFTNDGYISNISYAVTDATTNTNIATNYTFSSFNKESDVVVPTEIVNGATQGAATSKIDFFKLAQ